MHSRLHISGLSRSLPPLLPSPAPPRLPCVEGRQRAAPHSSFPPITAPLQTLHMYVWGPARVSGQDRERYFLLVVDDYTRYTTIFPLRGGEFSSDLLRDFCRGEGILQSFTLLASLQKNGVAKRRIGLVMEVACTSMIHAAAPHFLWPFAVRYAAHQLNLWPRVSLLETSPTLRWAGKVGDASVFQDVTFDKSVPFYRPTPSGVSQVDPLPFAEPVDVTVDSNAAGVGATRGAASGGAEPAGVEPGGAEPASAEPGGVEPEGAEPGAVESEDAESGGAEPEGAEPGGAKPEGAEPRGAESEGAESGGAEPRGAGGHAVGGTGAGGAGGTRPGGAGVTVGAGGTGVAGAAGPGGARTRGTRAGDPGAGGTGAGGAGAGGAGAGDPGAGGAGAGGAGARGPGAGDLGAGGTRAGDPGAGGASARGAGAGGTGAGDFGAGGIGAGPRGSGAGDHGAGGAGAGDPGAGGTGARDPGARGHGAGGPGPGGPGAGGAGARDPGVGGAGAGGARAGDDGAGGTVQWRPFFVPLPPTSLPPPGLVLRQVLNSLTEPREPESRPASPVRAVGTGHHVPRPRPPPVPSTHIMALRPSSIPLRDPLPSLPASSLTDGPDRESDLACAASPTVPRLLSTVVIDPSFESAAASALVAELVDLAAAYRLDYAASLVAESESHCPPSVGGECALGMDVFEDRVKRPSGSPPVFKARYVARGFSQQQGVDFFHTFSPTLKMTTLRVLLHVTAERDYELQSLYFNTNFFQGSLHEEIWLRRLPSFTGTTLATLGFAPSTADPSLFLRTETSLPPFNILVYVLQLFGFRYSSPESTPLPTSHLLSAPPSDESVEPSGPYPELVGCLMYLMNSTRPDLAYPLSILARYVASGRHRPEHWQAAKRVLRYLCSTLGMGLVLGGRGQVVLTGHADASWVDDLATQWSSQGYIFSPFSASFSWRSTRLSFVLGSRCEAEIYAGAMAAQELRWLTYLLTDLGEWPRSPPVLYVDNKAMIALCQEHGTKHIALRYFLSRELQKRGQLLLAYVATRANTADIFTKALQRGDHQCFCTVLGLVLQPQLGCLFDPIEGFFKKADGAVALLEGMRLLNEDDGVNGSVQECIADVDLTEWPLFDGCDADEDAYRAVSSDSHVGEVEVHHKTHFPLRIFLPFADDRGTSFHVPRLFSATNSVAMAVFHFSLPGPDKAWRTVVGSLGELWRTATASPRMRRPVSLVLVKAVVVVEAGYFDDVVVTVVAEAEGVLRGVRWW
ncbi:unnamed protein product [Closterium sp. NIES-53]